VVSIAVPGIKGHRKSLLTGEGWRGKFKRVGCLSPADVKEQEKKSSPKGA